MWSSLCTEADTVIVIVIVTRLVIVRLWQCSYNDRMYKARTIIVCTRLLQ